MSRLGLYNYIKLATNTTNYAKRMNRLSNKIFGEVVRPTDKSSMRVVEMFSKKPVEQTTHFIDSYYPPHPAMHSLMFKLRYHGLYRNEHLDFKYEMKRLRKLRGKGPPKKGEGKRATKKGA